MGGGWWWWCSFTKLCLTLGDPTDCSLQGLPVLFCLPEFAQTHAHWVRDTLSPSHPPLPSSPFDFQSFGHLMWRADSLEKTLIWGKIESKRWRYSWFKVCFSLWDIWSRVIHNDIEMQPLSAGSGLNLEGIEEKKMFWDQKFRESPQLRIQRRKRSVCRRIRLDGHREGEKKA